MPIPSTTYPFDPTGVSATNLITAERQIIPAANSKGFVLMIPFAAPYFRASLQITFVPNGRVLVEGVDYYCTHYFYEATTSIGQPIYGSITILDKTLAGAVDFTYQTIGGDWTIDDNRIQQILTETMLDPRVATWEQIVDLPYQFPPSDHQHDVNTDATRVTDVVDAIYDVAEAIREQNSGTNETHLTDYNNPHQTTAAQVGLGNVLNARMATNQEAIDGTANNLYINPANLNAALMVTVGTPFTSHVADTSNPHQVSKLQVGLGNVPNYSMATVIETQQGVATDRFVNPAGAAALVDDRMAYHLNDFTNPHEVTATQVGLGNVPNYPKATNAQALAGLSDASLMTPAMSKVFVDSYIGDTLSGHIADHENPHFVTKAQVGLSQVLNLPLATVQDTLDGLLDSGYITPRLLGAALTNWGGGGGGSGDGGAALAAHLEDFDNPHEVTAEQIDAYTKEEIDTMLAGIGDGPVNADTLGGLSVDDLKAAAGARYSWPNVSAIQVDDGSGGTIDTFNQYTSTPLASFERFQTEVPSSFSLICSGGQSGNVYEQPVFLITYAGFTNGLKVKLLRGDDLGIGFYAVDGANDTITIYSYNRPYRQSMSVIVLTTDNGTLVVGGDVIDMAGQPPPSNIALNDYEWFECVDDSQPGQLMFGPAKSQERTTEIASSLLLDANVVDASDSANITAATTHIWPLREAVSEWLRLSYNYVVNRDVNVAGHGTWFVNSAGKLCATTWNDANYYQLCSDRKLNKYQLTADVIFDENSAGGVEIGICIAHRRYHGIDYSITLTMSTFGDVILVMNNGQYNQAFIDYWSTGVSLGSTFDGVQNKFSVHITYDNGAITAAVTPLGSSDLGAATVHTANVNNVLPGNGPVAWGVVKRHTDGVTIDLLDYPNKYYPYFVLGVDANGNQTQQLNIYTGSDGWTSTAMNFNSEMLPYGRMIYSPLTSINYFVRRDGSLRKLPTVPFDVDGTPYGP